MQDLTLPTSNCGGELIILTSCLASHKDIKTFNSVHNPTSQCPAMVFSTGEGSPWLQKIATLHWILGFNTSIRAFA